MVIVIVVLWMVIQQLTITDALAGRNRVRRDCISVPYGTAVKPLGTTLSRWLHRTNNHAGDSLEYTLSR